jgi:hypothetical protein
MTLFSLVGTKAKFVKRCSIVNMTTGSFHPRGSTSAKEFASKVNFFILFYMSNIFLYVGLIFKKKKK